MSDGGEDESPDKVEDGEKQEEKPAPVKKAPPPAKKGIKNDKGDYIVTSFNIVDERTGIKKSSEQ